MRGARNSSRGTEAIASSTRSSVTPCGRSCSATILCAGVLTGTFLPRAYNQQRLIGVVRPFLDSSEMAPPGQATITPGQTNGPCSLARRVRAPLRAGIRPLPRLLPDPLAVRAGVVPDRVGGNPRGGDVHARLLPTRARPLHRADDDEAVARHAEEPQAAHASRALPRAQRAGALPQDRVRIVRNIDYPIEGRHVLLVEDIINTGFTLDYVLSELRRRQPTSLEVVTLLDRPLRRMVSLPVRYVGFQIPNDYVVGYGLDYRELYRNLPFICTLRASVYDIPTVPPDPTA